MTCEYDILHWDITEEGLRSAQKEVQAIFEETGLETRLQEFWIEQLAYRERIRARDAERAAREEEARNMETTRKRAGFVTKIRALFCGER